MISRRDIVREIPRSPTTKVMDEAGDCPGYVFSPFMVGINLRNLGRLSEYYWIFRAGLRGYRMMEYPDRNPSYMGAPWPTAQEARATADVAMRGYIRLTAEPIQVPNDAVKVVIGFVGFEPRVPVWFRPLETPDWVGFMGPAAVVRIPTNTIPRDRNEDKDDYEDGMNEDNEEYEDEEMQDID